MKKSDFPLKRLDDFAARIDSELKDNPFKRSPFGLSREGECISPWEMSIRRIGLLKATGGANFFRKDEFTMITVPPTDSGIPPLSSEGLFGWTGKINEFVAEMAVWWAFEIISDSEAKEFLQAHRPSVIFSYSDMNGPGEVTVKYNGEFWVFE
ncbi:MAG TPA: hypothetical protein PK358_15365 [Spirochaetota bacterium]|nr:hypothetical protein [Spirochaetota bacterium]HPJ36219.1 hypothetical protein [Spirochaetota bacterium]